MRTAEQAPYAAARCQLELPHGSLRYAEAGTGDPIVFLHGAFCNGDLWRKVIPRLADRWRCLAPDLPLGCHAVPLAPDADLTPPGVVRLILDFLGALGLERATVVGNDTGGAFAQLLAASHPDRVERLALVSCDAFENFPPRLLRPGAALGRYPRLMYALGQLRRPRTAQRAMYRWSSKHPLPDEIYRSYSRHGLRDPRVVRDLARVLAGLHPRYTLRAADELRRFQAPALVAWAADDRFFPPEHGRRLAELLPRGRFVLIPDSYSFVSEDQPERLADAISELMSEPVHDEVHRIGPPGPVARSRR